MSYLAPIVIFLLVLLPLLLPASISGFHAIADVRRKRRDPRPRRLVTEFA
ncbi:MULTISPECIES: hypothetical protein [unclassified Mycobacterium]|nr:MULTISPECIES: hypothetical protein [unclassified Mycobacterium]